jgi:hypothetical protein
MLIGALQSRLKVIEDDILRLAKLASETPKTIQQDNHLRLAQALQREGRELRPQIRKMSESEIPDRMPAC